MRIEKISVFCGSRTGYNPQFKNAAIELGKKLVHNKIDLVFGGGKIGLMGILADTILENGGNVIGVIPEFLEEKELAHPGITKIHVVKTMHERKELIPQISDGFIALPGGLGTLEELFVILTWAQLGFHQKPCGLLNIDGYYDGLITFLDHGVDEAFIKPIHRSLLQVSDSPDQLMDTFASFQPSITEKWIERDET